MKVVKNCREMQDLSLSFKKKGEKIGFVPTMGYLHEGHLALVDEAKKHADTQVMSVFVNPTQFGPGEDLDRYPRDFERDKSLAEKRGVDILFYPEAKEVYPPGDQSFVVVTELTRGLCGPFRPGHFRGVATVVAKLFNLVQPEVALFGEKDYQQLKVIQRMVRDLHFPVQVLGVPTVREPDGLALSSRNQYLDPESRQEALNLSRALKLAQERLASGVRQVDQVLKEVLAVLATGKRSVLEYAQIVDAETLEPLKVVQKEARLLLAVRVGETRLIDNAPLIPH